MKKAFTIFLLIGYGMVSCCLYAQVTVKDLGHAVNAFTFLNPAVCIDVNQDLNAVVLIHRSDPAITGDANSGYLRYDISTDGGASWQTDQGPVYDSNLGEARFPQCYLKNPPGNTNVQNSTLVYFAPYLDNAGTFVGTISGSSQLDGTSPFVSDFFGGGPATILPIPTHLYRFGDTALISASIRYTQGLDEFKELYIEGGGWSASTGLHQLDAVYAQSLFTPGANAFGSDYTSITSNSQNWYFYNGNWRFHQLDIFATNRDGSQTAHILMPLSELNNDTCAGCGPDYAKHHESNIVADANDHLHMMILVADNDFTTSKQFLYHVYSTDCGTSWRTKNLSAYTNDDGLGSGNETARFEFISMNADKDKLFFFWTETDSASHPDSLQYFPDLYCIGYDVNTNRYTAKVNMTAGTPAAERVLYPHFSPSAISVSGGNKIPVAYLDIVANNFNINLPVGIKYLDNVFVADNSFTIADTGISLSAVITGSFPCATLTASISAGGSTAFCDGDSVILTANAAGATSFQWNLNSSPVAGATIAVYIATQPGNYTVTVSDGAQSVTSGIITVTVHSNPVPAIIPSGLLLSSTPASAYQWYYNGALINGATSQDYMATQNGFYAVEVTDANGCTGISAAHEVTSVGIEENFFISGIELFPVPSRETVFLRYRLLKDMELKISIVDILGNEMIPVTNSHTGAGMHEEEIDIKEIARGIYYLRMKAGDVIMVKRIIRM